MLWSNLSVCGLNNLQNYPRDSDLISTKTNADRIIETNAQKL